MTTADTPEPDVGVDGLLYQAWAVIANASGWDDDGEWRQAAIRWRDRWHGYLDWAGRTLPRKEEPTK